MNFFRRKPTGTTDLRCSFCNKTEDAVQKLIAGPSVFICDECVGKCVSILQEDGLDRHSPE